jgi:hypothetical protein
VKQVARSHTVASSHQFCDVINKPKPADFDGQTRKPSTSLILRLNQETVTTGFEDKPEKPSQWFWGQITDKPSTWFWGSTNKPVVTGFEAKIEKLSQWFWGQITDKPSTLVLRFNQKPRAPHLHMYGADRTRCHSNSRSLGHWVPDLCDHPWSSAPGLLLLPRFSSLHVMSHLPPIHHETSKHNSPNKTRIKIKQMNRPEFEFKPRHVNDSSQSNQRTDNLISHRSMFCSCVCLYIFYHLF